MRQLRLKRVLAVGAALAFLVMALGSDTREASAGDHYDGDHYHRHGGGGGGGNVGVGVGIGVGTILLNEAIRRRQEDNNQYNEQQQVTQPKGCPEGLTWSRKKHTCVKVTTPEVAKCELPRIKTRKGCVYPTPETASCEWPETKAGKGCECVSGYKREHGECVKRDEPHVVDCDWPMIKAGNGCMCAPGLIPANGTCIKPPTVVVDPGEVSPAHAVAPVGEPVAPSPPKQAEEPKPKPKSKVAAADPIRCLPQDLYDLVVEAYGKRPALGPCPTACLPKPTYFSPAKLDAIAAREGITWCENCTQVGPYMPLASVLKLEQLAHVTICVAPDQCVYPVRTVVEPQTEIRTIFKNLPAGVKNEGNIAVVVGNKTYQGEVPVNAYGASDADAVTALLTDQLGYRKDNIIDLRDATLADFERVFGSDGNPGGEIAKRVDDKNPGDVFIYVASHGLTQGDDGKAVYLLPVDAKPKELEQTAYGLQKLYDNLGKTGARTTMLVLEANFAKTLDELIDPPNLPELEVDAMPLTPVPGLAVFKASDRDQRTIQDPEYGIGLFTRYIIEGLAGRADEAPLGNGDKRIDTVELYVYTSDMVRTAARKSFGLEQKPMLSKIDNLVVGQLSAR
jgi:hypothetical protein